MHIPFMVNHTFDSMQHHRRGCNIIIACCASGRWFDCCASVCKYAISLSLPWLVALDDTFDESVFKVSCLDFAFRFKGLCHMTKIMHQTKHIELVLPLSYDHMTNQVHLI